MLNLEENEINDISPLAGLTHISTLNLSRNRIGDITELSGLKDLSIFKFYDVNDEINDSSAFIERITAMTNLTVLVVGGQKIYDINALSELTGLAELRLWNCQITDISALGKLTGLTKLDNIEPRR